MSLNALCISGTASNFPKKNKMENVQTQEKVNFYIFKLIPEICVLYMIRLCFIFSHEEMLVKCKKKKKRNSKLLRPTFTVI